MSLFFGVQVSILGIRRTFFENLYVTDINTLNPLIESGNAKIKSRVNIKNGISRDFIGCKNL